MPNLDLMARVRASQSSCPFLFQLFFFCIMYVTQTPHRQHTSSAGCVLQPAGYNAIHACRLPAEQEATPHACGSLSALYYCGLIAINSCFCYRTLRSVGLRVSAAVSYIATGTATPIFYKRRCHMHMIQYRMLYVFQFVLAPLA